MIDFEETATQTKSLTRLALYFKNFNNCFTGTWINGWYIGSIQQQVAIQSWAISMHIPLDHDSSIIIDFSHYLAMISR